MHVVRWKISVSACSCRIATVFVAASLAIPAAYILRKCALSDHQANTGPSPLKPLITKLEHRTQTSHVGHAQESRSRHPIRTLRD